MSYLETTHDVYKEAALSPDVGLCCTTNPVWELPGLKIPQIMQEMNYGCGSTVHARDLINNPKTLYVGVGGGMELLQFSYFNRQKEGVIGVDVVDEMLEASRKNFEEAEAVNADVIVMGTHSHSTLGEVFLGSVSRKVMHKSKIPVLLVPVSD